MSVKWTSSVLQSNPHEDGCIVCKFLDGDRSIETLLHVIETLDYVLNREETSKRYYRTELIKAGASK